MSDDRATETDGQGTATDAPDATGVSDEAGPDPAGAEAEAAGGDATRQPSPEAEAEAKAEEELTEALDTLQAEFDTLNERHLRLAAEFTNYRRRQESEMTGAWGRAQADLVRRFLDVLDDLQRVSALDPDDDTVSVQSIVEGVDLVERKFVRTLEEAGAVAVDPDEGERFDPETMEAMMRVPADEEHADDTVAQVFQKGYTFRDQLVRPARVGVYKAQ